MINTGVYGIVSITSEKEYVGSTRVSFKTRYKEHLRLLRKGTHHCVHLQRSWNKYGESDFVFYIIEEVEKERCLEVEQLYIDGHDKSTLYNSRLVAYGPPGKSHEKIEKERLQREEYLHRKWLERQERERLSTIKWIKDSRKRSRLKREKLEKSQERRNKEMGYVSLKKRKNLDKSASN